MDQVDLARWQAGKTEEKAKLPPGPWTGEADRVEWRHESGLPCLIVRGPVGALCGYVGLPPGHPWHGKKDCEIERLDNRPSVHGGLTYSHECAGAICHVPHPGESDAVWWIGFDCSHCFDVSPALCDRSGIMLSLRESEYRDIAYVTEEVNSLARQVHEARS